MDRPKVATGNDWLGDRVFATLSRPVRRKRNERGTVLRTRTVSKYEPGTVAKTRERRRPAEFPAAEVGIEFKTGGIGYRLRT